MELILVYFISLGAAGVVWLFLRGLFYPKVDRRFRTGYKNNETPNYKLIKGFTKGYWIFIGIVFVLLHGLLFIDFNDGSRLSEDLISVYQHPNNKSQILDEISRHSKYRITRDTKYFHHMTYKDSLEGYILK